MELNTEKMGEYAKFLEENSNRIKSVCARLEEYIQIAIQCMDQDSGRGAAQRLTKNIENIKNNVPTKDDACRRLVLSMKYVKNAGDIFGGR